MNWTKAINGKMKNVMRNLQGCTINYCQYYLLAVTGQRADYTVSQKTRHQTLGHNFTNYYPIFKIFSLADSVVNLQQTHV